MTSVELTRVREWSQIAAAVVQIIGMLILLGWFACQSRRMKREREELRREQAEARASLTRALERAERARAYLAQASRAPDA